MKSLEAADSKLYNKQHSGCQASKFKTIGAQQMTNKSVNEKIHSYSLIYELHSCEHSDVVHLFFPRLLLCYVVLSCVEKVVLGKF